MYVHLLDQIGDWNPQLLRELKGRLKLRNVLLATTISLLGQFILFMSFQTKLPTDTSVFYQTTNRYCTGPAEYGLSKCLSDGFGQAIINWQLWSFDVFTWLSIIACFALLAAGTYLLISDLATEEKRDTLNFIRLSPQSPESILWGKILGVPIIFYIAVLLAIPLHLWSGLNSQIPLVQILSFYAVVMGASFLYFSAALLLGLVGSWLGGFQAWLGSGALLGYLILAQKEIAPHFSPDLPVSLIGILNPCFLMPYPEIERYLLINIPQFDKFYWFNLPLGDNLFFTVIFALLVYFVGAYFIWKSLQRSFQVSTITMLSKKQSYLLTASFTVITLGCANWQNLVFNQQPSNYKLPEHILLLMVLNLALFLYLIAAVCPSRQTLQEWARYRHVSHIRGSGRGRLIDDLIWGEKSPGTLAIAINAAIAITGLSFFVLVCQVSINNKINSLIALAFAGSLAVIYAALTQLILFMKNEQRLLWATGVLIAVIVLPPIMLVLFFSNPNQNSLVWLFSVVAPLIALSPTGDYNSSFTPFLAILGHFAILGLLVSQLNHKLKKAGESATKVLLAGN